MGLIEPILVGDEKYIQSEIEKLKWRIDSKNVVNARDEAESAHISCKLAKSDEISLIIKGHMHTDILMGEYIKSEHALRLKGERLSHIWFMTFQDKEREPIIITDGALNLNPTLETKKSIIKNVILRSFDIAIIRSPLVIILLLVLTDYGPCTVVKKHGFVGCCIFFKAKCESHAGNRERA